MVKRTLWYTAGMPAATWWVWPMRAPSVSSTGSAPGTSARWASTAGGGRRRAGADVGGFLRDGVELLLVRRVDVADGVGGVGGVRIHGRKQFRGSRRKARGGVAGGRQRRPYSVNRLDGGRRGCVLRPRRC